MVKTSVKIPVKSCAGFTLIEILVVLTIISIISAIAWNQYRGQLVKGKRSDAVTALTSARAALISFKSDSGNYPVDADTAFHFLTSTAAYNNIGYRASAPNTPPATCLSERGFQTLAGSIANSFLSCQGLWDIVVTTPKVNEFILTATVTQAIPVNLRDAECLSLTLDHLNVRNFTPTAQGLADNIPLNRCWAE